MFSHDWISTMSMLTYEVELQYFRKYSGRNKCNCDKTIGHYKCEIRNSGVFWIAKYESEITINKFNMVDPIWRLKY